MDKFPVLQSGFIANHSFGLMRPPPFEGLMITRLLFKDHLQSNRTEFFFVEVEDLHKEWREDPNTLRCFKFRERVLRAAFKLFNTRSLYQWLVLQNNNPHMTEMHLSFIKDTISYIVNGDRSMGLSQWYRVVEYSRVPKGVQLPTEVSDYSIPNNMADVVTKWVSWPYGFQDLLLTLHLIFGPKPLVTNVSERNV